MKTRNDLIAAALALLQGDGGAGQTPQPEDVQEIEKLIDGKLIELNRREIYWNNDPDEFEDEYIDPLAIILANTAAPKFGQPRNPASQTTAENTLRDMTAPSWNSADVTPSEFF